MNNRDMYRHSSLLGQALFALLITASLANGQTRSEPYNWKNVKVVAGGFIPGIVFSRVEKNLAYCRTDIGGCYRWDDATKKWIALTDFLAESNYFGGESIAPDPIDANTVYIAAGMYSGEKSAILRSHDRGKSWDVFPVSFRMGGNEDGRGAGERLAIDPNDNRILYFGSRHDGLWKSADSGATWMQVQRFPLKGLGTPSAGQRTHGGLSFVVFDPTSGARGSASRTIFVASCDPGETHLFRSNDAGETWGAVAHQPDAKLLPTQAQIDASELYLTYSNGLGPNGVTDGAVWKLDIHSETWTNITPDQSANHPHGGYFGLSLDRQHRGALAVSTMNRWNPGDTIWRSADGGTTWRNIAAKSTRDVSLSPYLFWGEPQPKLGWWMATVAIDPFDSDHAAYATGATMYATRNFTQVSANQPTDWFVWADGIEETAVITLLSPTEGAHLLSGFGDIGGFVHDDLDNSPRQGMYLNPLFGNTNTLDFAAQSPNIVVRSGQPHGPDAPLAWSQDGGHTWQALLIPTEARSSSGRRRSTPAIICSADGATFTLMSPTPMITRDRGKSWQAVEGLPEGVRPVADRVDPAAFYALDFDAAKLYISHDGGAHFAQTACNGLPENSSADAPTSHESAWPFIATPGVQGDLWFVDQSALCHSTDGGANFAGIHSNIHTDVLSFGKAPPGRDYPALFAIGAAGDLKAIWRSDDAGATWIRINDDQHQYGTRFRCISGDPRVFGRVYIGTDGRGILYADPVHSN